MSLFDRIVLNEGGPARARKKARRKAGGQTAKIKTWLGKNDDLVGELEKVGLDVEYQDDDGGGFLDVRDPQQIQRGSWVRVAEVSKRKGRYGDDDDVSVRIVARDHATVQRVRHAMRAAGVD